MAAIFKRVFVEQTFGVLMQNVKNYSLLRTEERFRLFLFVEGFSLDSYTYQ